MQPGAGPPYHPNALPPRYPTIGPYRVLGSLGAGGMGQVLRVADSVGRQLALKLLGRGTPASNKRFEREGEVTAKLNHPGIVRVHGRGICESGPYLVYELIEGDDLEGCFERLSREQLLDVTLQVADALGYAHAQGVIHRDVKPPNVLIDAEGRAYLADFGMAQGAGLERLTRSGAMVGTPHYMSPEQALGERERYGPPTDVWALGVILYQVLSGTVPFAGQSLVQLVAQITSEQPVDPCQRDPSVPRALFEVCLRALEKDPSDRYPDGAAFAEDLRRAQAGHSVIGRKPLLAARRARTLSVLAGVLVALAGATGLAYVLFSGSSAEAQPVVEEVATREEPPPPPDPKLEEQRRVLSGVLEAFASEDEASTHPLLDRLRRLALVDRGRESALWREGVAALAALESADAFARHLPLLELLAEVSPAARSEPGDDAARVTFLGVQHAGDLLVRGDRLRVTGDPSADRELVDACRELLELLASFGWQLREREPGERILDGMIVRWQTQTIPEATYWWIMLAGVRLDFVIFPNNTYMDPQGRTPSEERKYPWGEDTRDPWERFVALRIRLDVGGAGLKPDLLLPCLHEPEVFAGAAWELGPRHWASAAAFVAKQHPTPKGFELLERALELDPESPLPHDVFAQHLQKLGRLEEALEHCTLAVESFYTAYSRDLQRRWTFAQMVLLQVELLAGLDRRERAREQFVLLGELGPGEADKAAEQFPWLRE